MRSAADLRAHAAKLREIANSAPWEQKDGLLTLAQQLEAQAVIAEAREHWRIAATVKASPADREIGPVERPKFRLSPTAQAYMVGFAAVAITMSLVQGWMWWNGYEWPKAPRVGASAPSK